MLRPDLEHLLEGVERTVRVALQIGEDFSPGIPLLAIGMPGCNLYPTVFIAAVNTTTDSLGTARFSFTVPNLLGADLNFQWICTDTTRGPLPASSSDLLTIFIP